MLHLLKTARIPQFRHFCQITQDQVSVVILGGTNVTTRQAVARFLDRLNDNGDDGRGNDGTGILTRAPPIRPDSRPRTSPICTGSPRTHSRFSGSEDTSIRQT